MYPRSALLLASTTSLGSNMSHVCIPLWRFKNVIMDELGDDWICEAREKGDSVVSHKLPYIPSSFWNANERNHIHVRVFL